MENTRAGRSEAINTDILYKSENAADAIKELKPYTADTLPAIRFRAYNLAGLIGSKSAKEAVRKESVGRLLQGCKDKDSGVSGQCSQALQQFHPKDFDAPARQQLGSLLVVGTSYLDQVAQLAGYIGEPSHEQVLLYLLTDPQLSKKDKLGVQLALARMGNEEQLSRLMTRIRKAAVNDDVIYEIGPVLAYIRQKESINYLLEIIMSNEKNCESANPDSNVKILCAYRAMEFVAPVIKDYPLKTDASGDLDVKDYEKALLVARDWYVVHKEDYELVRDGY